MNCNKGEIVMENLYLFHATDRKNLDSIMKNGLLVNPPDPNWKDMYCEGKIFLAFDINVAEDYAMASETAPEEVVAAVRERLEKEGFKEIIPTTAGATISCHCGPHCLGILYFNDGDDHVG